MPIVSLGFAFAGLREGLARRRTGPQLAIVGPAGELCGEGPSADAGEKVAPAVSDEVVGSNIDN